MHGTSGISDGTSLGTLLREERQRQHLNFAQISARTRIRAEILETEDRNALVGGTGLAMAGGQKSQS